jgi:hypothetical protein
MGLIRSRRWAGPPIFVALRRLGGGVIGPGLGSARADRRRDGDPMPVRFRVLVRDLAAG